MATVAEEGKKRVARVKEELENYENRESVIAAAAAQVAEEERIESLPVMTSRVEEDLSLCLEQKREIEEAASIELETRPVDVDAAAQALLIEEKNGYVAICECEIHPHTPDELLQYYAAYILSHHIEWLLGEGYYEDLASTGFREDEPNMLRLLQEYRENLRITAIDEELDEEEESDTGGEL